MKIVVSPAKGEEFVVIVNDDATVEDIKSAIYVVNGAKISNQTIILKGRVLDNKSRLKDLRLKDMSKVFLVVKLEKKLVRKSHFPPPSIIDNMFSKLTYSQINGCLEDMKKVNPECTFLLNDADTIDELSHECQDPDVQLERQRAIDRILDLEEMDAGGFQELVSRYYKMEELIEDNTLHISKYLEMPTVIPEPAASPSTKSLPVPNGLEANIQTLKFFIHEVNKDIQNPLMKMPFLSDILEPPAPVEEAYEDCVENDFDLFFDFFCDDGNEQAHHQANKQPTFPQKFRNVPQPNGKNIRKTNSDRKCFSSDESSDDSDLGVD